MVLIFLSGIDKIKVVVYYISDNENVIIYNSLCSHKAKTPRAATLGVFFSGYLSDDLCLSNHLQI